MPHPVPGDSSGESPGASARHGPGTVLVVEKLPLLSFAVERTLGAHDGVSVVATADDPRSALDLVRRHTPDVVLLELHLPTARQGLALCRALKNLALPPRVIFFTADNTPDAVADSVAVGADAFIHKSIAPRELGDAVVRTSTGRPTWWLGDDYGADHRPVAAARAEELMTEREKEVLALLLQRLTNEEIARDLSLAHQTVKNYVSSVLGKLGVPSRRHLFAQGPRPAAPAVPAARRNEYRGDRVPRRPGA
ncbi:response regulator transcription factor [Streptomyces sp. YIM 98790]|uniref:response regulator n=1 Tax=Streptomyces sp. YIM 98790 TaxID=2689077 RepID=UPI001407D7DF|nr:response regulator transcription factor [Streptomyces sp. YIM 98790]